MGRSKKLVAGVCGPKLLDPKRETWALAGLPNPKSVAQIGGPDCASHAWVGRLAPASPDNPELSRALLRRRDVNACGYGPLLCSMRLKGLRRRKLRSGLRGSARSIHRGLCCHRHAHYACEILLPSWAPSRGSKNLGPPVRSNHKFRKRLLNYWPKPLASHLIRWVHELRLPTARLSTQLSSEAPNHGSTRLGPQLWAANECGFCHLATN